MAKRVNQVAFKGEFDFERMLVAEYDKKTEVTSYYSLKDALREFDGKSFSISIAEQGAVPTVNEDEEDEN